MPTEILAVGTAAANSDDVVVAANSHLTVALKDAAGPSVGGGAHVRILLKDDDDEYFTIGALRGNGERYTVLPAGTYRFSRIDTDVSCGVFSG